MCRKYILLMFLLLFLSDLAQAVEQKKQTFAYDDYAVVLQNYIDDQGMVDYKTLKAKPQKLEDFIIALNKLDPNRYNKWDDKEKIAFWLNAYNAFTLKAITDNYPIKPSFFKSRVYPKNSIRQISGVWDKITFKVMNKNYTLEYIEHQILRKKFNDPRIHMAMVCAAIGCPPLRNEPYTGKKLDTQLDDQSRKFMANPQKFRFDSKKNTIFISPIFKWFSKDFVQPTHNDKQTAIIEFISKYLDKDSEFFSASTKTIKIKYLDYDWSLNEQR